MLNYSSNFAWQDPIRSLFLFGVLLAGQGFAQIAPSPPPPVATSSSTSFGSGGSSGPISGMEFVIIPSGSFQMGSPSSESGRDNDENLHWVSVQSFELMSTEVTQGMWEEVMGSNPSYNSGDVWPVENVSWNQCQTFISRLNDLDPSHTYRLPTEAEWEYACRAGTTTRFYWGTSDSESVINRYCWYVGNSYSSTNEVGLLEPNSWGLYDIIGNVMEFCEDTYTSDYSNCPTNGRAYRSKDSEHVGRGGGWSRNASGCRSAYREQFSPFDAIGVLGFRLAR